MWAWLDQVTCWTWIFILNQFYHCIFCSVTALSLTKTFVFLETVALIHNRRWVHFLASGLLNLIGAALAVEKALINIPAKTWSAHLISVGWEWTNRLLASVLASSRSSQETVWYVLGSWCSSDNWLLGWSGLSLSLGLDVHSKVDCLVLVACFSFNSSSCVLDTHYWSLTHASAVLTVSLTCWNVCLLHLCVDLRPHVCLWLSRDIRKLLVLRVWWLLAMRRARLISHLVILLALGERCLQLSLFSLLCQPILVVWRVEICALDGLHNITLGDLHFLRRSCLLAFFVTAACFLVGSSDHFNLLVNFNWAMTDSKSTIRLSCIFAGEDVVFGVWKLQSWLVSRRARQFGLDVDSVNSFFQGIHLVLRWAFLCSCLGLKATSDCLRVALDDHWLERWHFLLVLSFCDVGRWWSDWVDHFTDVLSVILRRVIFLFWLHTLVVILKQALMSLLIRKIVIHLVL